MYLMVGPSAMELTPSSWLFPDLLPLRVLESSKAANWYAPQQERFGGAGCRRLYCTQLLPCRHASEGREDAGAIQYAPRKALRFSRREAAQLCFMLRIAPTPGRAFWPRKSRLTDF